MGRRGRIRIAGSLSRARELEVRAWYRSMRWKRPELLAYVDGRGRTVITVTDQHQTIWHFSVEPDDTVKEAAARERAVRLLGR